MERDDTMGDRVVVFDDEDIGSCKGCAAYPDDFTTNACKHIALSLTRNEIGQLRSLQTRPKEAFVKSAKARRWVA